MYVDISEDALCGVFLENVQQNIPRMHYVQSCIPKKCNGIKHGTLKKSLVMRQLCYILINAKIFMYSKQSVIILCLPIMIKSVTKEIFFSHTISYKSGHSYVYSIYLKYLGALRFITYFLLNMN